MNNATPLPAPTYRLDQWERAFSGGLVASSREQSKLQVRGDVHVVHDLPPQPEPVRTDLGPTHQIILVTSPVRGVEERIAGRAPHLSGDLWPGDLLLYAPRTGEQPHTTRWDGHVSLVNVILEPEAMHAACRAAGVDYHGTEFAERFPARDPLLEHLVHQLGAELQGGALHFPLYAEQLLQTVAVHLVRHHTTGKSAIEAYAGGLPPVRLRRVKDHVEAHLGEEIALSDLAGEADMSEYHFCRQFKESAGQSPYQYVIARRVERARHLLKSTDQPLAQVALAVGYNSQSHFTAQFKQRVGTTPGAFRASL